MSLNGDAAQSDFLITYNASRNTGTVLDTEMLFQNLSECRGDVVCVVGVGTCFLGKLGIVGCVDAFLACLDYLGIAAARI